MSSINQATDHLEESLRRISVFTKNLVELLEKELQFLEAEKQQSNIGTQAKIVTILQKLVDLVLKLKAAQIDTETGFFSSEDQLILDRFIAKFQSKTYQDIVQND